MAIMNNKPHIERRAFDNFVNDYKKKLKEGKTTERLGQAFYNHFNLQRLVDQTLVHGIYQLDGEAAIKKIKAVYELN